MTQFSLHYRPFFKELLLKFKDKCELVVWTAGQPEYANKIINAIDPEQTLFDMRIFRDKCYVTPQGVHIKDLRILGRDLDKCLIIDNAAYSFGFQMDNGVLVLPFNGEKTDTELLMLSEYISFLIKQKDPREFNRKHFRLDDFEKATSLENLKRRLLKKKS